ncbi:phage tail sheath subtilisin-like domain-containing protein [Komagataeibacter sp. SM21]|uniref:phage tail sheath subtilisin-like domain-containing protein n=1 Tax=Komagataeibacter sp. SM21 TaxID=3242899 RepID=UPI0035295FE3
MSGSITVPNYPDTNRVPGFYFALDNSKANTATQVRRVLIVGQMLATGSATAGTPSLSAGPSDAIAKYGAGSQCARMVQAYRQVDTVNELWVLPLADEADGVAATGKILLAGTASASGTLWLYIGDSLVSVAVTAADTAATIAENVVTAAASVSNLPVSLAEDATTAGQINVTALNKGEVGNTILLGLNLLGTAGAQATPAGITVTLTQMAAGAQNPSTLASALSGIGDRVYDLIPHPYMDATSLTALKTTLNDVDGRWCPLEQLYGQAITAYRGTYGDATGLTILPNDQHQTVMPISDSPSDVCQWAAWIAARTALSMLSNPALPITGLSIPAMPPTDAGRFIRDQRNSLLYDGLSTFTVSDSGTVMIERLTTTYRTNASGQADNSYLDIETLLTAQVCLQDLRSYLAACVGGYILVADGSKIPAGAQATTAALIGKLAAARYQWQSTQMWVQNPDEFAAAIVATNEGGGVVKLLLPYQLANQLWVIAGDCQFTKP